MVVHDARATDTDTNDRTASECDEVGQQRLDRDDRVITLGLRDVELGTLDHRAVEIGDHADEGLRAREIQTDDVVSLAVDVEHHRGLARSRRRTGSELDDEGLIDEVADDAGDRDPTETELPGQVGAREAVAPVQRLEHECAVVAARLAGAEALSRTSLTQPSRGWAGWRRRALDHMCK